MERTVRKIDELNILSYKDYFDVMALTERQRNERIRAAEEFEDTLMSFLLSIDLSRTYPIDPKKKFVEEYTDAVKKYLDDDFVPIYVDMLAALLEETTLAHIDEEYYTSLNRAVSVAANESNTVLNHKDFNDAVKNGYKRKQWITEHDDRVRPTHIEVEDTIIPINDLFVVGNAVMRYPHDFEYASLHPEELNHCRCSIAYLR